MQLLKAGEAAKEEALVVKATSQMLFQTFLMIFLVILWVEIAGGVDKALPEVLIYATTCGLHLKKPLTACKSQ
jgi:hypothetical protein